MSAIKPYLDQRYEEIKQKCQQSGKLFIDESFPANDTSLYRFKQQTDIVWKRPHEIVENPKFIVDDIVPNDLDQGGIGDCWLISACAAVATVPEYIQKVIPMEGQTFDKHDYAGIFHFRFWRFGDWVDVVVDDLLPVQSETNTLTNCHNNKDPNEMFGPLLEKAYAKLNTCYEFLVGGNAVDALVDMTGGISESYNTKKSSTVNGYTNVEEEKLWDILFNSFAMKSLCGASINVGTASQEDVKQNGLVLGHAYGVESVVEMYSNSGGLFDTLRSLKEPSKPNSKRLIRLRNPWGEDVSWKGDWNSESNNWKKVSDALKKSLKYLENDGQFYMSFKDFCTNFDDVQFVHVNLNAFTTVSNDTQYKFNLQQFYGEWIPGKNSGGCGNDDMAAYWTNPQYNFSLKLDENIGDQVTIIVSLMQTEQTRLRAESDGSYESSNEGIFFKIYTVVNPNHDNSKNGKKYLSKDLQELVSSDMYLYQREVCKRFDLPAGDYVLIPSLFVKDKRMKFIVRVFIETGIDDIQINELNKNFRLKPKINVSNTLDENIQTILPNPIVVSEPKVIKIIKEKEVKIIKEEEKKVEEEVAEEEVPEAEEAGGEEAGGEEAGGEEEGGEEEGGGEEEEGGEEDGGEEEGGEDDEYYDYEYDEEEENESNLLGYQSQAIEKPVFIQIQIQPNKSKACSLM